MMSKRVLAEIVRCIVIDTEKEFKYEGSDERERDILIIDAIMAEFDAHGIGIVEIDAQLAESAAEKQAKLKPKPNGKGA